jgi:hypothetical protein
MKSTIKKIKLVLVSALVSTNLFAQNDMSSFLKVGINDGNKVLSAYASPLFKTFGAGMNAGWFNTAKVHGLGGFSVTICPNVILVPGSDKTFDVTSLGLSNNTRVINGKNTSSTFFGSNSNTNNPELGSFIRYPGANADSMLGSFRLPQGIGVNFFMVPTAQVAVGVGIGTEVSFRYMPQIKTNDISAGIIGFGIKHDIKQWIPGIKLMPFDLSVMAAFTRLDASVQIAELKADQPTSNIDNPNPNKTYSQSTNFVSSAYTVNLLLSKKLSIFTPYVGLGFQSATTEFALKGEYPITDINPNYNPLDPLSKPKVVRELKDPISLTSTFSDLRATAGFRFKLSLFTIHADYTLAKYPVASVGIGLHVQSLAPPKL